MGGASGSTLFELVEQYFDLGIHRTGTEVDDATASWFAGHLATRGFATETNRVQYSQWTSSSELLVGGKPIDHLPVFYEWTGQLQTDRLHIEVIDPRSGGHPEVLSEAIARAQAKGADALVLATDHPDGSLVAINRIIGQGSGFPTVLVAGRDSERVLGGQCRLEIEATEQPGFTNNVTGSNKAKATKPPLMITTPLNGWFGCAGERGTGIAVTLDLLDRFADRDIIVVGTGGHELTWFGAQHWVDNQPPAVSAIIHVGASVAVVDPGTDDLATTRLALTSSSDESGSVTRALAEIGLNLTTSCTSWVGEGQSWSQVGVPLLSFSGAGIHFHTPEDTPEAATTPSALARVADAFEQAVEAFTAERATS